MKILNLKIKNIRGIKNIKVQPDGKSIVVFGPNGVGKSAIVDAVDFLLSGKISRLIGEGTKCLNLKEHGCHVDSRDDLKNTVVTATVEVDSKKIVIERSINKPSSLKVKPKEDKALVESYLRVAALGQYILSRREILKYITAEAGKRAKEIMSLLDLMDIENTRSTFVTVKNEAETSFKHTESNFNIARSEVSNLLSLTSFSEKGALDKVNELREVLGGSKIAELSPKKIKENLKPYPFGTKEETLSKDQIENTIKEIRSLVQEKDEVAKKESELKILLEEVKKEAKIKQYSLYKKLFEAGITLVDESNVCPLCGRKWEEGDFKTYLDGKKKETDVAKEKQEKIDELSIYIKKKVDLFKNDLANLVKTHGQFKLKTTDDKELEECNFLLDSWSDSMDKPVESFEIDKWPSSLLADVFGVSFLESKVLVPLDDTLKKVGQQLSNQQDAWDTLTKMEDKGKRYKDALVAKEESGLVKNRASSVLTYFEKARDEVLESIYDAVKDNFDEYYRTIHSEDEQKFVSKISHVKAELIFEVDFFERGMFPPHALHSEGHQDSMGLCLFFALNKYLMKDAIKIVVLDDVVMSIDRSHRRAVCQLLKKFFPDKQLIITTHDTAWAKQLRTEGVVNQKNMIHFVNWNIDTGPIFELDKDLWDRIKEDLDKNDVPSAAHKLRRNAECFFENICDFLNAKLPYKGHHQWELGDYAPAAISAYKEYLKKAKSNFQKMKQQAKFDKLTKLESKANDIIARSQIEQWIINENVHYNKWADFSKEDFKPVVDAFKELFALFSCTTCGNTIELTHSKGKEPKTIISCGCGEIFWNIQ